MLLETAAIASAAKPLVEKLVTELITPKITQFAGWCRGKYNQNMIPTADHFQEYLERMYDKYSIINTLVLHNSRLKLREIYVAQTLVKERQHKDDDVEAKIDKMPVKLIKEYKKILITDTAGMGKSTITRRMFIDLIDSGLADVGIPIYVELNRLNKDRTIIKEIQDGLDSLSQKFDSLLLFKLIQTGGFIFFFDGYDEISIADRAIVTKDIQSFISKAGTNNYYILTSRPEDELTTFGDFQAFKIKALTKKEAFELLRKYDMSPQKEISKKLINILKSGEYRSIDEYLENPLLVSLLFAAYDHKQTIPLKKHLFYRQVYEAFFDTHDLSKGIDAHQKCSGLDIDDFSRVLKFVGYVCLIKIGVKFDKETILKEIERAKEFCANLNFKKSDFFKDMQTSVPLFCKDGNEYKWVHKSLMEYFAARFIADDAKQNQDKILTGIYRSEFAEKYTNLLDLYYDIDNPGFMKNIELPLLHDYIVFYKKNLFESSKIKRQYIEERIGYLYDQIICVEIFERYLYNKDIFEDMRKRFENKFNVSITSLTITSPGYVLGCCVQPQREFLSILSKRKNELFEHSKQIYVDDEEGINIELGRIDVHTGDEDENTYKKINNLMIRGSRGFLKYLKYQECCNEVKRINKIIKNNEDSILLEVF